jgi:aldehyde dehydrogenase (NAD+)
MYQQMRQYFASGATQPYAFRKAQLQKLRAAIQENESAIMEALFKDLHKSAEEAYSTEIGFIYTEISHVLKHLKSWMSPSGISTPLLLFPSSSKVVADPLGVTLIIAPWNYPFQLLMAPLIGAIAGGNCAVLKPSEMTPNTAAVIEQLIISSFDADFVTVVQGNGAEVVPNLMNSFRFDHVFFTGSIPVGKEIAKLAAPQLVPVTLELGGKSPCVVDKDANIKVAAQRITWGKFTNVGQTCVAPDYLLVHESRKQELVEQMQQSITNFYGNDPRQSRDYGRIINAGRFKKLESFLRQGEVISGGQTHESERYMAPTLMQNVSVDQPMMQEEIFGPILPVYTYREHDEAMNMIRTHSNPLALYVFTENEKTAQRYVDEVPFGGGCINNTLMHLANADLPFGGVGNSGVGAYHGKYSFETFTRKKSILTTATWVDPKVKYPPYAGKLKFLKWFMK